MVVSTLSCTIAQACKISLASALESEVILRAWRGETCVQMIEQNVYEISAERVAERLIEAFAAAAPVSRR
jgi:hypothetical protein